MSSGMLLTFNETYKGTKEGWVTGYTGSDGWDIAAVVASVPASSFLNTALLSFLTATGATRPVSQWHPFLRFLFEFVVISVPALLAMTLAASSTGAEWSPFPYPSLVGGASLAADMLVGTVLLALLLDVVARALRGTPLLSVDPSTPGHATQWLVQHTLGGGYGGGGRKAFISAFRSGMMMCTCLAILAVDFPVFPRRQVKCETFGTSLMDVGVGAFVVSASLVSRQARRAAAVGSGPEGVSPSSAPPNRSCGRAAVSALWETVLSVSPLLFLGGVRLVAHAAVNYQVHESEYGRHWNFFFTMASVALLATVVEVAWVCAGWILSAAAGAVAPPAPAATVAKKQSSSSSPATPPLPRPLVAAAYFSAGLAIAGLYQAAMLSPLPEVLAANAELTRPVAHRGLGPDTFCAGLGRIATVQDFILCAPRTDSSLLMQNREGVAGVIGSFALYLCGVGLGIWLLVPRRTVREWRLFFAQGVLLAAALWGLLAWTTRDDVAGPVSRRLVNAPYVLWILALNWTMLVALLGAEMVGVHYAGEGVPLVASPVARGGTDREAGKKPGGRAAAAVQAEAQAEAEAEREPMVVMEDGPSTGAAGARRRRGSTTAAAAGAAAKGRRGASPSPAPKVRKAASRSVEGAAAAPIASAIDDVALASVPAPLLPRSFLLALWAPAAVRPLLSAVLLSVFRDPEPFPVPVLSGGGSVLLESFNVNFLALFMSANILVGVVNLTVYTVHADVAHAMAVLTAYIFAVCTVAWILRRWGVALKFW